MSSSIEHATTTATTTVSESAPTVTQAINAVMREVTSLGKTDRNDQQGFMFRGIDAAINKVGPALRMHGVVVVPVNVEVTHRTTATSAKGKPIEHVCVRTTYRWIGPAGDSLDVTTCGEAMDAGDKALTKAQSVAWRVCLLQTLSIPTNEPDPDSYSYERASQSELSQLIAQRVLYQAEQLVLSMREKKIYGADALEKLRDLWQYNRDVLDEIVGDDFPEKLRTLLTDHMMAANKQANIEAGNETDTDTADGQAPGFDDHE